MASACEILVEHADETLARELVLIAQTEALRIEHKFSRYREDSVIAQVNAARGKPLSVDDEMALLLDFAGQRHPLSGGLFDVTSRVLRTAWRFDGSDHLPDPALVEALCRRVGWHRVVWQRPWLTLPAGTELDSGGIGKKYTVDRVLALLLAQAPVPVLVNFGGDLVVSGPRSDGRAWQVGVERPLSTASPSSEALPSAAGLIDLSAGALATSGDARRYLLKDGIRYSHILDPRSGWPVRDAPRSVTTGVAMNRIIHVLRIGILRMLSWVQTVCRQGHADLGARRRRRTRAESTRRFS